MPNLIHQLCILNCLMAPPSESSPATPPASIPWDLSGPPPTEIPWHDEPAPVRLFLNQSMLRSFPLRAYLDIAAEIDEESRTELAELLNEYERHVKAEAERVREARPEPSAILERALEIGGEFERVTDQWLEEHPDARDKLAQARAELDAIFRALQNDRQQIVDAAIRAGLPKEFHFAADRLLLGVWLDMKQFAKTMQQQRQADQALPPEQQFASAGDLAEWELKKLLVAKTIRDRLRQLLPAERRDDLDEELLKLARHHEGPGGPATAPATTARASEPTPANVDALAKPEAALRAYLDAIEARDRERMKTMVMLPEDPERREWVLSRIEGGMFPPEGTKVISTKVTMDGPVAVAEGEYQLPDGTVEQGAPAFFVQRDGRWYFVVDMFEGGGLTREEMEVIDKYL